MLAFLIDPWFSLVGKTAIRVGIYRVVAANFAKLGREVDGVDNWEFSYPVVAVLAKRDGTHRCISIFLLIYSKFSLPAGFTLSGSKLDAGTAGNSSDRACIYRQLQPKETSRLIAVRTSRTAEDSQTLVSSLERNRRVLEARGTRREREQRR